MCVCTSCETRVFKIIHEGEAGGTWRRGRHIRQISENIMMSAREKIRRLVDQCNTCLAKDSAKHSGQCRGEIIYRLSLNVRNCVKESLFTDSTGWIHKIC